MGCAHFNGFHGNGAWLSSYPFTDTSLRLLCVCVSSRRVQFFTKNGLIAKITKWNSSARPYHGLLGCIYEGVVQLNVFADQGIPESWCLKMYLPASTHHGRWRPASSVPTKDSLLCISLHPFILVHVVAGRIHYQEKPIQLETVWLPW